jgi:hypothetical protein
MVSAYPQDLAHDTKVGTSGLRTCSAVTHDATASRHDLGIPILGIPLHAAKVTRAGLGRVQQATLTPLPLGHDLGHPILKFSVNTTSQREINIIVVASPELPATLRRTAALR